MNRPAGRLRPWHPDAFDRVPVTVTILVVLAVVFVLEELWGGSTSTATLVRMGAVVTGADVPLTIPRSFAYGVLHIGLAHVAVNAFSLWNLGVALEPLLGRALYSVLFLGSVLTAGLGVSALEGVGVTAGASGGLFGLLGAVAVLLAIRYRAATHPYERAELRNQLAMLILPNVLISLVPGVSFTGHATGFVFGLAFMGVLRVVRPASRDAARTRLVLRTASALAVVLAIGLAVSVATVWIVMRPWEQPTSSNHVFG